MKNLFLSFVLCILSDVSISAQNLTRVYDSFVQFNVTAPKTVQQGNDFVVFVKFIQTSITPPFNKNTDMSKMPVFPSLDGLDRLGEPESFTNIRENMNGGKVESKTYSTSFVYKLNAAKAGVYTISGVRIIFRGHTIKANDVTVNVPPKNNTFIPPLIIEDEITDEVKSQDELENEDNQEIIYEKPFVRQKTSSRATINAVTAYPDRTEVEISYTSKGENIYSSSNCFIRDTETKQTIMLRTIRGDIGFDKKYYAAGTKLTYTMVFPPMNKSWRNIDIVENVSGGFAFLGVGLALKSNQINGSDGTTQVRKQISNVNWNNVRNVELNNYESDFLFTDGLVPIYNKDVHKWGFFDEKGNQPISFVWDYDNFRTPHFGGGYCIVSKVKKVNGFYYTDYYTINHTGQPVKLNGVKKVTPFCDGFAAVVKEGGKYVYIKGNGQEAFPALARYIGSEAPLPVRPFVDGLSAYYDYNKKKYGFINKQGGLIIPAKYDDVHDFSEGLAAVKVPASSTSAAKWGFINTKGEMVIAAQFSYEPSSFSMGRAVVQKRSGSEVMIDTSGNVVSPEFDYLFPFFSTGYALAKQKGEQGFYVINNDYRIVTGPLYGIDYKHKKYKEYHGAFQTPVFGAGYADSYTYLTTGENFFKDYSWKQLGQMSENLIHFKSDSGDGFIDYQGNVVFQFVKSEF
ncbi:WG repeat-containing protein [Coprobacter sp.]